MNRKLKITLFPEHAIMFSKLSDNDIVKLIRYIMQYLNNQDIAPLDNPVLDMVFTIIQAGIKPVDGRSETSSKNGKLGGRPRQKKPNSDLGFETKRNDENEKPPNNKIIIKEELFNRGIITQNDNISSNEDNYPSSNINPKKEGRIIDSSNEKRVFPVGNDRKKPSKESQAKEIDCRGVLLYFNERMQGNAIKPIASMTERRKGCIRARAREYGKEAVKTVIDNAAASDWLNGRNNRGWVADFNWLFLPNNFIKVLEGNYENKKLNTTTEQRQRLKGYSDTIQRLLTEASQDNTALVNRLRASGDIQRVPPNDDNSQR